MIDKIVGRLQKVSGEFVCGFGFDCAVAVDSLGVELVLERLARVSPNRAIPHKSDAPIKATPTN